MIYLYTTFLYQPIFNLFIGLYQIIPGGDAGVAVIAITLIVRFILYPFYTKQVKSQKAMQDLQPKLKAIREQFKDDQEKQAKAMMSLYKDNKVNPITSCLPILIQLPLFIAVYQVFRDGLTKPSSLDLLYGFINRPEMIDTVFLGLVDLAKPNAVMAILAGLLQFWQAKMLMTKRPEVKSAGAKDEDMMAMMNKQLVYIMPITIIFVGFSLPSGLSLYWIISTGFMIAQQYWSFRHQENHKETQIDEKTTVIAK